MACRHEHRRRGLTLPEVLTSLMVLMVIGGTVVSIFQTSLRQWRTGTVENLAEQKATWVIQRMAPDLHQAMSVEPEEAPFDSMYLSIELPNRIFDAGRGAHFNEIRSDATNHPYLVSGNWAVYYRGDEDQQPAVDGKYLWRRLVASDRTTIIKVDRIADNIVDNPPDETGNPQPIFHYWPSSDFMFSVLVTITVEERIGSKVAQCTMHSEISLRN